MNIIVKKYVRVQANFVMMEMSLLFQMEKYSDGDIVWVEVES